MTDISTNVLEKILEEIAIIVSLESDLVRNQVQILDSMKKIAWRSSELISGVRFKIRDVIFERDWDCIDYLKIMISSGATAEIISNLAEYVADLRNLSTKLTDIIEKDLLNRSMNINPEVIPTCIPTIARISGSHIDIKSLKELDKVLDIVNTNYNNSDIFCRKAVLRSLEILGEYSKKLSEATKSKFPGIPWLSTENEGGNLGSLRNIAEHPKAFQKDIFDSLCDNFADSTIQQIMHDLEEFHGRLKNYLSAPDSAQLQVYLMPEIIELFKKLTTIPPKQSKFSPIESFTNNSKEVQEIMRVHLCKDGAIYRAFSILFQEAPDESAVRALLKSKFFNIVPDSEMRHYKENPAYISQSSLKKKEKILLKVLDVKFVQIRKIFSNEEVTSIIDLKNELVEFLSLERDMIDSQLQAITPLIKISPIALLEQYRLPDNGDKIDELIRIINKELKISSVIELERKLEDIIPHTSGKVMILSDLMDKLRDCVETVSYTEKAIREIDDLISMIEKLSLAGTITSYEDILHSQSIYYFAVQSIIEQVGMVAKDSRPDAAGIEFKVSDYETISPRRMLLIKIFRDLIAHYPERADENIVKAFFRDLVAFTKADIQQRKIEISSGKDIWLYELLQPKEIKVITEEILDEHQGSIFAILRDMGFKSSVRIIGRVVGSEIASRATLDILVEFNEGIAINPLKVFELELVLGDILNSYVKVHTEESLKAKIGMDYVEADCKQIIAESISLVEMMQSVSFKKQFNKGNVENFLLPDGVLVVKGDPNFTLENIAKAKHMTFLPDEEDDSHQREDILRIREEELKDYRIISVIKKKALLLAGYISQKLASIDEGKRKLFLELIKIDKELDALIDSYFVAHRKDIFVSLNRQNLKSTTKQGFRDYVKKTLPSQLERDFPILTNQIASKSQEKYLKMNQIQGTSLEQETNFDDWILEYMTLEFKVPANKNNLTIRTQDGLYRIIHLFPLVKPQGIFNVVRIELPQIVQKIYTSYIIYRDLKFLFDEIDDSEVVDAFITALERQDEGQIMPKMTNALNHKFIDLDDFVIEFSNNRATGGYQYMKSPFYDEVQSELRHDDVENPYERLRSKGLKLITSEANYGCLSKIRALKDFTQKNPTSGTTMHEVEAITFSRLSEIEGSKCDKTQLLKGTASTFLAPTIFDLDEVARLFGVAETALDRYVGGRNNYNRDKVKFAQYREFLIDQNILENIIVNMNFYKKKNIDINIKLSVPDIDYGVKYVLNAEFTKNEAIISYLRAGIDFYSKLQIKSSFFMANVNNEVGEERIRILAEGQLLKLFMDIVINKLQASGKTLIPSTIEEVINVVEITRLQYQTEKLQESVASCDPAVDISCDDAHLVATEKFILGKNYNEFMILESLLEDISVILESELVTLEDKALKATTASSSFNLGSLTFIAESSHSEHHENNIKNIIMMIKNQMVSQDSIIFLERSEFYNLGMNTVKLFAYCLKNNVKLPSYITKLPIYHDAWLYNIAVENGLAVVGAECYSLTYSRNSLFYYQAREEYMVNSLMCKISNGKNVVFLVGSSHIYNLVNLISSNNALKEVSFNVIGFAQNKFDFPSLSYADKYYASNGLNYIDSANSKHNIELEELMFKLSVDSQHYFPMELLDTIKHISAGILGYIEKAKYEFGSNFLTEADLMNQFNDLMTNLQLVVYFNAMHQYMNDLQKILSLTQNLPESITQKSILDFSNEELEQISSLLTDPEQIDTVMRFKISREIFGDINEFKENIIKQAVDNKIQFILKSFMHSLKSVDVVTDIIKYIIQPTNTNVISLGHDALVLSSYLSSNKYLSLTTPLTAIPSIWHAFQQEQYMSAGIRVMHSFSNFAIREKDVLGVYAMPLYFGINGVAIFYDLYNKKYAEAALQTAGLVMMSIAPTLTATTYAVIYTSQNIYSLYQLHKAILKETQENFTKLLNYAIASESKNNDVQEFIWQISLKKNLFSNEICKTWNEAHRESLEDNLPELTDNKLIVSNIIRDSSEVNEFIVGSSIKYNKYNDYYNLHKPIIRDDNIFIDTLDEGVDTTFDNKQEEKYKLDKMLLEKLSDSQLDNLDYSNLLVFKTIGVDACQLHGYVIDNNGNLVGYQYAESDDLKICGEDIIINENGE